MQQLDRDEVARHVPAAPEELYDHLADVTRMPELSPEVVSCRWLGGATGPAVGARFVAVNRARTGRTWKNRPVVTVADRGREFAFSRTEPMAGTILWRYRFAPDGDGTLVTESYEVLRPVTRAGWWVIEHVFAGDDRRGALRRGMKQTLERLHAIHT